MTARYLTYGAPHKRPPFVRSTELESLREFLKGARGEQHQAYTSGLYGRANSALYLKMLNEDKKKKEKDEDKVKTLVKEKKEAISKRKKALDSRLEDINKDEDFLKHIEDLISRTQIKEPELIKSLSDWKGLSIYRQQSYHNAGTLLYEDESANNAAVSNAKNYTIYYAPLVFSILQNINEVAQLFITNKTLRDELMEFFGWKGFNLKSAVYARFPDSPELAELYDVAIIQEKINTGKVITIDEAETFIKKGMKKHEKEEIINILKMRQEEPKEEFNEVWEWEGGGKYSKRSKTHKKKSHKKRARKSRAKAYRKTKKGRSKSRPV
jgi:hypothetical protein